MQQPRRVYLCAACWSVSIAVATPTTICHHPWVHTEIEYWPRFSCGNIRSQLDGFHFCKLTQSAFSFNSCWDVSCGTLQSSFPLQLIFQNMMEQISKQNVLIPIFWKFIIQWDLFGTSHLRDQCSKISSFGWSVHDLFRDFWVVGVPQSNTSHDQCYPLTPGSIG